MCRFLVLRSARGFDPSPMVEAFRERCRRSVEFQGHGFGMAFRTSGRWERYRSLTPVWEDSPPLPRRVESLVVHARSAFRNEGIDVRNNMPFYRDELCFVFNGELRGVRLRAPGRIGAEKIFHVILEQRACLPEALAAADRLLRSRARYVRAMNVALTDGIRDLRSLPLRREARILHAPLPRRRPERGLLGAARRDLPADGERRDEGDLSA